MRQDDISCLLAEDINVCTHYDSIHHECKDMVRECGMFNKHCMNSNSKYIRKPRWYEKYYNRNSFIR